MKPQGLLDDVTASALDFPALRDALAPASAYGQRTFDELVPFLPGAEAEAFERASRVAAIAERLSGATLDAAREIFRNVPDAATAIARASMGDALDDAHLLELQRFFDACERLDALTAETDRIERAASDDVRAVARALELGRTGKFGFYLADGFDAQLAKVRATLASAQAEYDAARGRETAAVAHALGREISGSEFIVMRSDVNGSLPPGVRVVREGPTYVLCEIDAGESVLAALARREDAAAAVGSAEESARRRLSEAVRERAAALDRACSVFGETDVLVAAARFTRAHACVPAEIVTKGQVTFEDGVFVPLAIDLEREGRKFTPIALSLDGRAVLTGPNMGGKSVCLRVCGLIALFAAFGLPVPARRASVSLFTQISWLGAGTDAHPGSLLSSFAREVVRLRGVLESDAKPALALLDEFARTTTPREGAAIVVAVLAGLGDRGAVAIAATHLSGIAGAADVKHYAVRGLRGIPDRAAAGDLHAALATLADSMDYTVAEVGTGEGGGSDAIALAALLGLDEAVVTRAYEELGRL